MSEYYENLYDILGGLGSGAIIAAIVVIILAVIAQWKLFSKAHEAGWKSIIPIVNEFVYYRITWGSAWYFFLNLLALIPFVGSVAAVVIYVLTQVKLGKAFGKGTGFILGLIFLPSIFMIILGFGDAAYQGPSGKTA